MVPACFKNLRPAILCLHYVLHYKYRMVTTGRQNPITANDAPTITDTTTKSPAVEDYPPQFYHSLPVRTLLTLMDAVSSMRQAEGEGEEDEYQWMKPALYHCVAFLCPQDLPTVEATLYGIGEEVLRSAPTYSG